MTMHDHNHPNDERLSALAGGDAEARADEALRAHVDACQRCSGLLSDLHRLRVALHELPDVAPSRPIQLLPPVDEPRAAGGDWLRRLIGPLTAAGAGLLLIGAVGISLDTTSQVFENVGSNLEGGDGRRAAVQEDTDEETDDDGSFIDAFIGLFGAQSGASPETAAGDVAGEPDGRLAPTNGESVPLNDGSTHRAAASAEALPAESPAASPVPAPDARDSGSDLLSADSEPMSPWLVSLAGGALLLAAALVLRYGLSR